LVVEEVIDGAGVDGARGIWDLEEGFEFAGEPEVSSIVAIDEGFFAESIAGDEELLLAGVPDGEGEHAAEFADAIDAVVFVEVDDGFGVGIGAECVATLFESGLDFAVVVDFAVEGDPDGFVFVGEGLVAATEIDDGESSLAEDGTGGALGKIRDAGIVETAIIRTAMDEDVGHPADD